MNNTRIQEIANMVEDSVTVADIGTDHAFLPVLLIQQNKAKKVYACDIAEGPLNSAKETIHQYHMEDQIIPILSNGFEHVPNDTEVAVIAGMGFYTARDILEAAKERLPKLKQIIVEVNRDVDALRKWLSKNQYRILDEQFIHDKGHDYIAISWNTERGKKLTEEELLLGPVLMQKRDGNWLEHVHRQILKIEKEASYKKAEDPSYKKLQQQLVIYKGIL